MAPRLATARAGGRTGTAAALRLGSQRKGACRCSHLYLLSGLAHYLCVRCVLARGLEKQRRLDGGVAWLGGYSHSLRRSPYVR